MEPWKAFERDSAKLFGGKRYWANSGERIDFQGPLVQGQCKLVKSLSLEALTKLVEEMDNVVKPKIPNNQAGVVCVKVRRGKGQSSPPLVVMSFESFMNYFAKIAAKGTEVFYNENFAVRH